jgi:hypothetical protein
MQHFIENIRAGILKRREERMFRLTLSSGARIRADGVERILTEQEVFVVKEASWMDEMTWGRTREGKYFKAFGTVTSIEPNVPVVRASTR